MISPLRARRELLHARTLRHTGKRVRPFSGPVLDAPAPLFRVAAQAGVGIDGDRGPDPLEHRQVVVAVRVERARREVDAVRRGPLLGERDLVMTEAERRRAPGECARLDLELARQYVRDADAL